MSSAISQLSRFSSIVNNRRLQLHNTRSYTRRAKFLPGKDCKLKDDFVSVKTGISKTCVRFFDFPEIGTPKVFNVMNSDEHGTKVSHLESKAKPRYIEDASTSHNGSSVTEGFVVGESNGHIQGKVVSQPKRAAKIHDFCLGIPFGGLVLSGGLVGFIFYRNPVTLSTGILFGGALLALSTCSLKVWRQEKSSFPFILGQAVLSLALLGKNFQAYSLTKKLFPAGFNIIISVAMLCFYSYVVISGGNPPPKKKSTMAVESS